MVSWSRSWKFMWLPQGHASLLQNLPHWAWGFARSENHGHFHRLSFDHGCARNPRMEGYRCRFPHACLINPETMNLPTASKSSWSQPHSLVLFQWQDCPFKKPVQIGLKKWICKNSWWILRLSRELLQKELCGPGQVTPIFSCQLPHLCN